MPKRALAEKRPWLLASIAVAIAFYLLRDEEVGGLYLAAIKGAAVGLLAVYSVVRASGSDARMIAGVMALSAMGDIALEFWFQIGGGFFFAAHMLALVLYLQPHNRRGKHTSSQKAAAVALLLLTPLCSYLLSRDPAIGLYALALGGMASAAWMSRFSRYHVGIGAVIFVASDLLIFARIGGEELGGMSEWLIWPTYYLAQFLICTGVVQTLRRDHQA